MTNPDKSSESRTIREDKVEKRFVPLEPLKERSTYKKSDHVHKESDQVRAARVLGAHVLLAATVLGGSILLGIAFFRSSLASQHGWYYIFLLVLVTAYVIHARFGK